MAKNEFLPFGIADGANVLSNDEYGNLSARTNGFSSGVAKSQELNKVWRQTSVIASVVAQFIAETNNQDVLDNGNTEALQKGLLNALRATVGSNIPVASQTVSGITKLSNSTNSNSEVDAATPKAVKTAYDLANTASQNAANANNNAKGGLEKSKNGSDILDQDLFNRNIGSCRAFSSGISIGGGGFWTTEEFIAWLKSKGAFNHPYWMCKGTWSYADNRIINDTGCGAIHLAGSVVEVMGYEGAITIRVTTPTTSLESGTDSAQFTYINHGVVYRPGWRRDFNTVNKPTANDVGAYSREETDGRLMPVGSPIPWPHANPPAGYIECKGQYFDASKCPRLAEAYPSGVLPDLRGEFIRGLDAGRGIDPGRNVRSVQRGQSPFSAFSGYHETSWNNGRRIKSGFWLNIGTNKSGSFEVLQQVESERETRPRNVAFLYIVRAA
ncbi:Putative protein StfE (modular protein) [Xenorhabdus nematophila F1]|nr:Putative protein StfE (modular protein) [Xenorhabdus nematophila F1]